MHARLPLTLVTLPPLLPGPQSEEGVVWVKNKAENNPSIYIYNIIRKYLNISLLYYIYIY